MTLSVMDMLEVFIQNLILIFRLVGEGGVYGWKLTAATTQKQTGKLQFLYIWFIYSIYSLS